MPPSLMRENIAGNGLSFKDCGLAFIYIHSIGTLNITMQEEKIYTVSEINKRAKEVLEGNIGYAWVKGEVSNLTRAMSGHLYFTLKDENSEISAARFRNRRVPQLPTQISDGMTVLAYGRITIYEPRGRYQFVASIIQPAGMGEAQLAFERLKEKLRKEGLFDKEHKKPVPAYPMTVGVVTSPTGAAIRDICSILERRWPLAKLYLFPVTVQGETASAEIASAIGQAESFNEQSPLDLLIIGRGGGSLEDMAPFNDERLARTIFDCPIPIVSAVGHEIDFTISDFVADLRAPTPSAAAELVAPDKNEIVAYIRSAFASQKQAVGAQIERRTQKLQAQLRGYILRIPERRLETLDQQLDLQLSALTRSVSSTWKERRRNVEHLDDVLRLANPSLPLHRGYSLTYLAGSSVPLRDASAVSEGKQIETRVEKGKLLSRVEEVMKS